MKRWLILWLFVGGVAGATVKQHGEIQKAAAGAAAVDSLRAEVAALRVEVAAADSARVVLAGRPYVDPETLAAALAVVREEIPAPAEPVDLVPLWRALSGVESVALRAGGNAAALLDYLEELEGDTDRRFELYHRPHEHPEEHANTEELEPW